MQHYNTLILDDDQLFFKQRIIENCFYGVFLPQGTGKTLTILEALRELKEQEDVGNVLVLAPVRALKNVWLKEIRDWQYDFKPHILHGSRRNKIPSGCDFFIASNDLITISRDNKKRWAELNHILAEIKPRVLIVDESSKYRNYKSIRTKRLMQLTQKCEWENRQIVDTSPRFKRVYLLSGTPMPNRIENLWSQFFTLDGGKRLGRHVSHFRQKYTPHFDTRTHSFYGDDTTPQRVWSAVSDVATSIESSYGDKILRYRYIYCDFTAAQMRDYKKLALNSVVEIKGHKIVCDSTASRIAKLRQLSGGCYYYDDERGERQVGHFSDVKRRAALEFIEAQQGRPVLLGYNYTHEAEALLQALIAAGYAADIINGRTKDISDIITRWQHSEIDVLLGQPQAMGHAIDGLQHGGSTVLWYSVPGGGDFEIYDQFNARIDRRGQKNSVIIHHLIANDTFDALAFDNIHKKGSENNAFMTYLSSISK